LAASTGVGANKQKVEVIAAPSKEDKKRDENGGIGLPICGTDRADCYSALAAAGLQ